MWWTSQAGGKVTNRATTARRVQNAFAAGSALLHQVGRWNRKGALDESATSVRMHSARVPRLCPGTNRMEGGAERPILSLSSSGALATNG